MDFTMQMSLSKQAQNMIEESPANAALLKSAAVERRIIRDAESLTRVLNCKKASRDDP
jgi:hypothetical protein